MKTRILIVDDHKLFRDGLKRLIDREPDLEVIGEAENGEIAITLARELKPDVILMDVKMPVMDGIEATRRIVSDMPGMKVLALSMYSDASFLSGMMQAGAVGYVLKGDDYDGLSKTIHNIARLRVV